MVKNKKVMKIYLIRHGESEFNTGKLDPPVAGAVCTTKYLNQGKVKQSEPLFQKGYEKGTNEFLRLYFSGHKKGSKSLT